MVATLQGIKNHVVHLLSQKKEIHESVKSVFPRGQKVIFARAGEEVEGTVDGHGNRWGRPEYVYLTTPAGRKHTVYVPDIIRLISSSE